MSKKPILSSEIRQSFLEYFRSKGHHVLPSSSLVPQGDPTLLLTNAGMVQIKPYFMGEAVPPNPCLTSVQKCFRTTDIDTVGNERNLTFFEMLGNFSVADYFKEEAIGYGWEFSTQVLGLDPNKIWISVYLDDDEALTYWRDHIGVPAHRIVKLEENWWGPAGKSGPCGPDSEMYYDRGESLSCGRPTCAPGCDCPRFLEFWNLVFMQFYQDEQGERTPLPKKNIDTGMGLERAAMLQQRVSSVYNTDLFQATIQRAEEWAGVRYGADPRSDFSLRVIADHSRAVAFLIADGVLPSNEGRGYVLRRVLRRAVRHGRKLGIQGPFLAQGAKVVIQLMGQVYPELREREAFIERAIEIEESRFDQTLSVGLTVLDRLIGEAKARDEKLLPGEDVFRLYDTYGFPLELTVELATEKGLGVDKVGFGKAMERQREQARAVHKFTFAPKAAVGAYQQTLITETSFLGYETTVAESVVVAILRDGQLIEALEEGQEADVILRETTFYAEAGGQVGDTGIIVSDTGHLQVQDTYYPIANVIAHRARATSGYVRVGQAVRCKVDSTRRWDAARNHTGTHLLHRALRGILGSHVLQSGSLVASDRLRFDFSHFASLEESELRDIAQEVNAKIRENMAVSTSLTSYSEATKAGAIALFGEKYGEQVRMVSIGDYSREVCGGTHVQGTGQIGFLHIIGETGVGSGFRRVEAVTGRVAEEYVSSRLQLLERLAERLGSPDIESRVEQLQGELQAQRKQVAELQKWAMRQEAEELLKRVQDVDGVRVIAVEVRAPDIAAMREMGDILRSRLGSGVIVLGANIQDKPAFVAMVTPGLKLNAGQIVRQVAAVTGGGGGGSATMAQAGGKDASKLAEALGTVASLVKGG